MKKKSAKVKIKLDSKNLDHGFSFENYSNCLKMWLESKSKYINPPKSEDLLPLRNAIIHYSESLSPLKPKKNLPKQRTLENSIAIILQRGGININALMIC